MNATKDSFELVLADVPETEFTALNRRPVHGPTGVGAGAFAGTAVFKGFDLDDRPLISGLRALPHGVLVARTTVALRHDQVGSTVAVVFDEGDVQRPIILGVVEPCRSHGVASKVPNAVSVETDDHERIVLTAEREITLRCGKASVTLTRAGKVIIQGAYIVSRSSGYNKIKGAAVDIN